MNYYPFHIGDYASATRHLSWDEDMAYRRLMDAYYTREEPIPLDSRQVYRLVCATTKEQRDAVDVVLSEFFEKTSDGWRNSRCDSELEAFHTKSAKASQSAKSRWRNADGKRTQSDCNANASQDVCERIENGCEGNAPNTNTNTNTNTSIPNGIEETREDVDDCFTRFWIAYPKKVGKEAARKAFAKVKRPRQTLLEILSALEWQLISEQWTKDGGQFIPNPATYLNQGRWNDEPTKTTPRKEFAAADYGTAIRDL